ncbi:hypothetical protein [Bdellovibrio bacteriovorus]|uniref:Uncharacterized protein n=1 Tax=Bdellovibrio bacteriovorus TaxID=959 RepID=A0A1Z3N665_BDEBC|nr:hypothetical protein [Bdellovibrio bacteriovorus]ASD62901.1 hypothetical protein B9G79_04620 [Bdellovibrio bacteriovorus]
MKRLLKAMATTAVTLVAMQANAIQVNYSFRVNSSGPSIYPCNAGLLTKGDTYGDKKICYYEGTNTACTPKCDGLDCEGGSKPTPQFIQNLATWSNTPLNTKSACEAAGRNWISTPTHASNVPPGVLGSEKDQAGPGKFVYCDITCKTSGHTFNSQDRTCSNPGGGNNGGNGNTCVCSTQEGRKFGNYVHASWTKWEDRQDPHTDKVSGISPYFATLFGEVDAFDRVLDKLSFNLGSETYNAAYFVDICYRGSQIDYSHYKAAYKVIAEASLTDIGHKYNGKGYSDFADLEVQAHLICTSQTQNCENGNCSDTDEHPNGSNTPQFDNDITDIDDPVSNHTKYLAGDIKDLISGANFVQTIDKNTPIYLDKYNKGAAAKFCKVRYIFKEKDGLGHYPKLRKWQKHGANICTHTKIEMADLDGNCPNCK